MTKSSGKSKEKKPYNPLNKKGALRTRQDYIEYSYINGVRGEDGEFVIRPMTASEREWLEQFIDETDNCRFKECERLKQENRKLKKLKREYRQFKKLEDYFGMDIKQEEIVEQENLVVALRDQSNSFYIENEERHEIFNRDYERRMDLYNNAKINGDLQMFDLDEYDKFTSEALAGISGDDIMLNQYNQPKKKRKKF